MAEQNLSSDVSSFFGRLRGEKRIKTTDHLKILDSPETERERQAKSKIQTLSTYVRNKTWQRRHVEYFDEYRRMVYTYPIIKAAIDIYAEDATSVNDEGNVVRINCEDKRVKEELEELLFTNLNINTRARLIIRELCKFGNTYAFISSRERDGVVDLVFLPPDQIVREQMYNPENLDSYRFTWLGGGNNTFYEPWELVHWKNSEDIEMEPYGVSVLRPALDTWRRVVLIREALVVYRITRAPQRLLFKIGTDGMTGEEAFRFAQEMKKQTTSKSLVNPQTGEIDFKYNPMAVSDNFYVPTYEGSPSDIQVLEGANNLDAVEDYKIIKDDLFAALKIPKSFLSFEEDLSNKGALSAEDVRFSRTIQNIQSQFIEGLVHIAIVHLFLKGFSKEQLQSFTLEMENPSVTAEKKKMEIVDARINLAKNAWDANNASLNLMSYVSVCRDILKLSDEEIKESIRTQFAEKKIMWRLQQIRETGTYMDPEIDKKLAELKGLTGNDKDGEKPTGFDGIDFGGTSLKEMVKRHLDEELGDLVKPVAGKASKKMIHFLEENIKGSKDNASGPLIDNLEESKKDFGMK